MAVRRTFVAGVFAAVAIVAIAASSSTAHAQRRYTPADLRSGKVNFQQFSNQRAYRSMQHAYDYARDVQVYAPVIPQSEPVILRSDAEQIGRNIKAAQEQVAGARKQAAGNVKAQAAYDSVEKHLVTAAAAHEELHAECHKDDANPETCAACCDRIAQALEKAMTEHEAIIKQLNPASATAPGAAAPGAAAPPK